MRKFTILLAFLTFLGMQVVNAQLTVTGTVTSAEDGGAIPGATVIVKGTTVGVTTDLDGNYSLEVPAGENILAYSFVGMKTQDIAIDGRTSINVALEPDVLDIEGVVVTAIGIARETKALGYSVSEVSSDEITKTQNANVVNSISGKVAGVQVTSSSGAAGGSSFITIRGAASITGDNQPLFVVDGVPINNDQLYSGNPDNGRNNLNDGVAYSNRAIDLNPDDIASMSVLKGGAATALYGLRAANGAIIITTKKGSSTVGRKINVNYSGSVTFDQITQMPDLNSKYAQGYSGEYLGPETGFLASWGPKLEDMVYQPDADYIWSRKGRLVPKSDFPGGEQAEAYDNIDNFFKTGVTYNNALSLSGGNDETTYYFSMSDMKTKGVIPNNEYRKTTVKVAGETKLSQKIKTSASMLYTRSGGDRIQQGSNTSGVMLGLLRTPASFDNANGFDDPVETPEAYQFADGSQRNYRGGGGYDNPFWTVNKNLLEDEVNRIIGNAQVNYMPVDWINVTYRVGTDFYSDRRKNHFAIGSRAFTAGQVSEDNHFVRDFNSDLIVSMNRDFFEHLKSTLSVGHNMYQHYWQQKYIQADGLVIPEFYHISNGATLAREQIEKKRTAAYYADLGLSWKSVLFMNFTGRYEWSTTLPEDNNAFFYPSANLGFVFTELPFLKDNDILPFGKFRTSYAVIANDASIFATRSYFANATIGDGFTTGLAWPFLGTPGFEAVNSLGNNELKPEKQKSFEIGLDLRFLNNRIGLDLSYYNNQNEDLILGVPIAATTGYVQQILNAASMENKGFEVLLKGTPVKTNDFEWNLIANFSKNENKVTELAEGIDNVTLGGFTGTGIRAIAGRPYQVIFGNQWLHADDGQLIIDPATGFPIQDEAQGELGEVQSDFTLGLTNDFRYKNWSFSFLWDIKQGGMMWNGTKGALYFFGAHGDQDDRATATKVIDGVIGSQQADGSWVATGEANSIEIPLDQSWYIDGPGSGFTGPSEDFIEDADWVRLREVNLSYRFNSDMFNNTFIQGLSVYFSGRNLLLFTDYTGIDPESSLYGASNAQGMDYFNMPNTRSYTFGLKLDL